MHSKHCNYRKTHVPIVHCIHNVSIPTVIIMCDVFAGTNYWHTVNIATLIIMYGAFRCVNELLTWHCKRAYVKMQDLVAVPSFARCFRCAWGTAYTGSGDPVALPDAWRGICCPGLVSRTCKMHPIRDLFHSCTNQWCLSLVNSIGLWSLSHQHNIASQWRLSHLKTTTTKRTAMASFSPTKHMSMKWFHL